uniref:Protein kinase domain-containing protein n=1 Tax=Caenorhabditis tropicalis TaxID=1561998 RepID=A0A1I7T099_9PELO
MMSPKQRRSPSDSSSVEDQRIAGAIVKDSGSSREMEATEIDPCRGAWGNQLEFLLSTLGMAVGLGNIWRFPTRAYNNGGCAFLVPYISCAFLFGLPAVYLEFLLGQYHRTTAPIIFRRIAPILQGVGWMAVTVSSLVSIYYIIIIGWSTVYMASIVMGHTGLWNRCGNSWNVNDTCLDSTMQSLCQRFNKTKNETSPAWANLSDPVRSASAYVYFKGECYNKADLLFNATTTATEQYFLSVIVTLPYFIIVLLFFRGISLPGAEEGLKFYLGNPDWSKILDPATWGEALKQLCFSLGIGYGGLIGMSSFSRPNNNCFRDSLIVIIGDTVMSIVGGAAVFSTLGFLAQRRGCKVSEVVNDGFSLAFVAFPEALGRMPLPQFWSFLFFLMLFFLGISTEVAYVNVFCSSICDQFVNLRKKKWMVVIGWCLVLYALGIVMVFDVSSHNQNERCNSIQGGFYWFVMFDEYAAGVSSCCAVTAEILIVAYVYGRRTQLADMKEMFGPARNRCTRWFGPHSPYFGFNWMFITPVLGSKGKSLRLGHHEYKLVNPIATGPFSSVFLVEEDGVPYAMKVEAQEGCLRPVLKLDHAVLTKVGNQTGFPSLIDAGRTDHFKYVVMQLVGPDLSMLLEFAPQKQFSKSTIYKIALQTLDRLRVLHNEGWLNRDVKAQNFAVGLGEESSIVYMLDFGLTRKYMEKNGARHLLRPWGPSVGTFPYAPLNSLGFLDQTPADDIEGWLYMIIHLLNGLPWHNSRRSLSLAKVREWKMYCRRSGGKTHLFKDVPDGWADIFDMILKTPHYDRPDYNKIANKIISIALDEKIDLSKPFDWQVNSVLRSLVQLGPLSCDELTNQICATPRATRMVISPI